MKAAQQVLLKVTMIILLVLLVLIVSSLGDTVNEVYVCESSDAAFLGKYKIVSSIIRKNNYTFLINYYPRILLLSKTM